MVDYITEINGVQVEIPAIEIETLKDKPFPWKERKLKTIRLAKLYDLAGMPDYAERARTCATWLQYMAQPDGSKQLYAANFCQLRLCPMCTARRAKKSAYRLSQVLDLVEAQHDARYIFLTLTVRNVHTGEALSEALGQLTTAWARLMDHRHVKRAIHGWFRAIEITRQGRGYHPHLHAVLAVEPVYFSKNNEFYITHSEWLRRWQTALRVDYKPSVRVQVVKAKGQHSGGRAAALEAAKYPVKDEEYISPRLPDKEAVKILTDYTYALHRRRLTAFGGWLKEAAQRLGAERLEDDGDLVHIDDNRIREDVAELIEDYNWNFGAGDYILSNRRVNPLRVVREDDR